MNNPLTAVPMRAARWSARHPWAAVLAWLALIACAVGLAMSVSTKQTTDADYRIGESGRADAMYASGDFDDPGTEQVLIDRSDGRPLDRGGDRRPTGDLRR